jgi:CPA2 family monovalent cation:H+ antiporter-2
MVFHDILIALVAAVSVVAIFRKLHLPPILGYMFAGALVGPAGLRLFENVQGLDFVAEFGVVFLLFTIGLELSLPQLIAMRRTLLNLGGLQVLTSTALTMALGFYIGLPGSVAFTIAGCLALSSTAVVTKQLLEQGELYQEHGKISLSILLFQDLAAVPFLIIVPSLVGQTTHLLGMTLLIATGKGILVFFFMLAAGRFAFRPLLHQIALARSSELFMLTTLLIALGSAWLTEMLGLSLALGAFLTGVILAETEYRHQIESDILPFRDILLGFFFLTVGMKLRPEILLESWGWILAIVLALILTKTVIIALLGHMAGINRKSALRSGLALAQGGEFGFALLTIASKHHVIDAQIDQVVTASIIVSIFIAPFLIRNTRTIARWFIKAAPNDDSGISEDSGSLVAAGEELKNHVILCGYGRVGQTLARFLEKEHIRYLGLDLDPTRLREASRVGDPIFYGNSAQLDILEAAGIQRARLLILSYEDYSLAHQTLLNVRAHGYTLPVLVRTRDDTHLEALQLAGATEVIPETLEASLTLASHMLLLLGVPSAKITQDINRAKGARYQMLRAFFKGEDDTAHLEENPGAAMSLHAVEITENAFAVGKSIQTILERLAQKDIHVDIMAYKRNGVKSDAPKHSLVIQPNDVIILKGINEELFHGEELLLRG